MRAELYRPDSSEDVVAVATWARGSADLEVKDGSAAGLERLFRPTPVVVDDPGHRREGTHGEVVLQPGTLEWFREALLARAPDLGLSVRFVPGEIGGGWDPAAAYRTFEEQVELLTAPGRG